MKEFKPMLSASVEDAKALRLPLFGSPKLDGIRAMVRDGVLVSRNMKPIPNIWTQSLLGKKLLEGLDGELIVGPVGAPDVFRATTSGVMSVEGKPEVTFYVFDCMRHPEQPFHQRLTEARRVATASGAIHVVDQTPIVDLEGLDEFEGHCLELGYEGVMLRHPESPYKYGRGTLKAHDLMKLKRFADAEAKVVGVYEQQHNTNEAKRDALGRIERSSHKAGKVGKGVLGGLTVVGVNGPYKGKGFNIGTGFDDAQRAALWREAGSGTGLNGRIVKYKYFPSGSKDAPRFPVFLGWRAKGDM